MALVRFRRLEAGGLRPSAEDESRALVVQQLLGAEALTQLTEVTVAASGRAGRTVHSVQDHIGNRFWARPGDESSDDELEEVAESDDVAEVVVAPKKGSSLGGLVISAGVSLAELCCAAMDLDGPVARKVINMLVAKLVKPRG